MLSPTAMFTSVKFSPVHIIPSEGRPGGDLSLEPVGGHHTVFFCLHHLLLPKSWDRSKVRKVVFQAVRQSWKRSHNPSLSLL